MHHRSRLALLLLLFAAACKIEQTPREVLDRRQPGEVEQQEAADEVRSRILLFRQKIAERDLAAAVAVLSPTPAAHVISPEGGGTGLGEAALLEAVRQIDAPTGTAVVAPNLYVQAGVREGLVWFAGPLDFLPVAVEGEPMRLRISGVFAQVKGEWRLVQMHLSRPAPFSLVPATPPLPPAE